MPEHPWLDQDGSVPRPGGSLGRGGSQRAPEDRQRVVGPGDRTTGFEIDDDDVSHLGPTMTEHINVHGRYHFNLDQAPKGLRDHARPSSRR